MIERPRAGRPCVYNVTGWDVICRAYDMVFRWSSTVKAVVGSIATSGHRCNLTTDVESDVKLEQTKLFTFKSTQRYINVCGLYKDYKSHNTFACSTAAPM